MKTGKYISATIFALALWGAGVVQAQGVDAFRNRLSAPDTPYGSRVQVVEHGSAAQAVRSVQSAASGERIRGYRIRIFSDNSQHARTNAVGTVTRFKELFPGIPVYLVYENPYWKVTVGNCATSEEAIILMGRVKGSFDRAFLLQEQIPVALFAE